jgi:hypothetical protein
MTDYTEQVAVIDDVIGQVEGKLRQSVEKATIGDYIRLLQLRKDMEAELPREIRVRWIETLPDQ